jgi:hypothetical protein
MDKNASLVVRAIYCPFLFISNLKPKTCRDRLGLKRPKIEIFKSYRMVCKFAQLDRKQKSYTLGRIRSRAKRHRWSFLDHPSGNNVAIPAGLAFCLLFQVNCVRSRSILAPVRLAATEPLAPRSDPIASSAASARPISRATFAKMNFKVGHFSFKFPFLFYSQTTKCQVLAIDPLLTFKFLGDQRHLVVRQLAEDSWTPPMER